MRQRRLSPLPDLGAGADLRGFRPFPAHDPWNAPVIDAPADPDSDAIVARIGRDKPLHPDFGTLWNGAPNGIPYVVVDSAVKPAPIRFEYGDESDPGPYPVPRDAPIEGGPKSEGDRHVIVLDREAGKLYELFSSYPQPEGGWRAGSGAIFDLVKNTRRPAGWTSADAAGLPIFPGLVRYDEVRRGEIRHALRFTVTRSRRAYVAPATHFASRLTDSDLPPMGMRVRLKRSVRIDSLPPQAKVIARALQVYGMIVADNGGDWFVSGAPDPRWDDEQVNTLKRLRGADFEVVRMGRLVTG